MDGGTATLDKPVSKKKRSDRVYTSAKIEIGLYRDIKALAAFYGVDANDYLTDLAVPIVADRMARMAVDIGNRAKAERAKSHKP